MSSQEPLEVNILSLQHRYRSSCASSWHLSGLAHMPRCQVFTWVVKSLVCLLSSSSFLLLLLVLLLLLISLRLIMLIHPSGSLNVSQQPLFTHTTEWQKNVGIIFDDSKLSKHPQLSGSFGVPQFVSFANLPDERKSIIEWKQWPEQQVPLMSKIHVYS